MISIVRTRAQTVCSTKNVAYTARLARRGLEFNPIHLISSRPTIFGCCSQGQFVLYPYCSSSGYVCLTSISTDPLLALTLGPSHHHLSQRCWTIPAYKPRLVLTFTMHLRILCFLNSRYHCVLVISLTQLRISPSAFEMTSVEVR